MSTTTPTPPADDTATEHPDTTGPADGAQPQNQDTPDTGRAGNAEAAKYRTRLRAAEAERDTIAAERDALAAELDTLRREAVLREHPVPEDHRHLLKTDGTLEEFTASAESVSALAHRPQPVPLSGTGSGKIGGPSWGEAIRDRGR